VIAISTDDVETQKRFRESLKAPYHFVADEKATLVKLFDVKVFLLTMAKRITFVVGPSLKILSIQEGSDAIDPSGAVSACSIKPPESLKYLTGDPDAGPFQKSPEKSPEKK
jgi:peroxiredoxin